MADETATQGIPLEARQAALQQAIGEYLRQGYRVLSQTDSTAQLVRPKKFSVVWFLLTVGFYLFYHILVKKERQVYLQVDASGAVLRN